MKKSKSFQLILAGVTGDDLFAVSPAEKPAGKSAPDAVTSVLGPEDGPSLHDMLAMLEGEAPLPLPDATTAAEDAVTSPHADALLSDSGMQFLEGFTNLNDYLFTVNESPMEEETGVAEVSSTATRKRKWSPEQVEDLTSSLANPDHDDYAAKKPRQSPAAPKTSDRKYRERRIKNNIASKRSRETRKQKFSAMEQKAIELEASNAELELRVQELEDLTKKMKDILVKRLSQST